MTESSPKRISTFGSRLTSIISVTLVLLLAGIMAIIGFVGHSLSDELRRNMGFTVKFESEIPDNTSGQLISALENHSGIHSVVFLSADSVMAQERVYLGEEIENELDVNPYSSELEVKVTPLYANPDSIDALCAFCERFDGVDELITESAVIEGVHRTLNRLGFVLGAVCLVLFLISIALINNTVSLSIYSRRFLIHTMKLVGATPSFIRRPFVVAGIINGVVAGLMASLILFLIRYYASNVDAVIESAISWWQIVYISIGLLVAGALLCSITAFFAADRYIRAKYDEMFLQ